MFVLLFVKKEGNIYEEGRQPQHHRRTLEIVLRELTSKRDTQSVKDKKTQRLTD